MGISNVFGGSASTGVRKSRNIPQRQDDMEFAPRVLEFFNRYRDAVAEKYGAQGIEARIVGLGDDATFVRIDLVNTDTSERGAVCFIRTGAVSSRVEGGEGMEGYIFKPANDVTPYCPAKTPNPKDKNNPYIHPDRCAVGSIWSDEFGMDAIRPDLRKVVGTRG